MLSNLINAILNFAEIMMPVCYRVVNMSITASYIFVFIMACRLLLKKAPKVYSYALWLVLLFRLLCPASLPSPVSILNLLQLDRQESQVIIEYVSPEIEISDEPAVDLGIPALTEQVNQSLPAPSPGHSATPMQIQAFFYTNIWLLGVYGFLIYALISVARIRRITRTATLLEPGVYECESLASPFAKGLFPNGVLGTNLLQAKIYLPTHLSMEDKQIILAHERTHLRRKDPLVKGLFFVALVIHWFNPIVWVAFFLMVRDMEMSCDEMVLQGSEDLSKNRWSPTAIDYSETLLHMASTEAGLKHVSALGPLAFGESSVSARIKNALKFRKVSFRARLVLAVVCGAVILACSCNPSADSASSGGSSSVSIRYYWNRLTEMLIPSGIKSQEDILWEHRTPYIGDNSAVGNLLGALSVPEELQIVSEGMELVTSARPYRLIIRYRAENPEGQVILSDDSTWIYTNMALLFPLIENVDIIETQISYGEETTYYCMMTRFEASHAMDGNLTDMIISTKEDWEKAFDWIRDIDFRIEGTYVLGYDEAYAQRHYTVVTLQSFDKENQRMLVSGKWQDEGSQATDFYIEMDGLVYDEYGDYMLAEELKPGDRLLVGYVTAENGVPASEIVYKQKVPDWFARE